METPAKSTIRKIEVLGPGCARCFETHKVVRHVVDQAGLGCTVEKVESVDRMVDLGVLRTPAIAIDGQVVHQGSIPRSEDVMRLLGLA